MPTNGCQNMEANIIECLKTMDANKLMPNT